MSLFGFQRKSLHGEAQSCHEAALETQSCKNFYLDMFSWWAILSNNATSFIESLLNK